MYAINYVCDMIESDIIGNPDAIVDVGAILGGDDIDDYRIESISKLIEKPNSPDNHNVAVRVRFHAKESNAWYGKFYFV